MLIRRWVERQLGKSNRNEHAKRYLLSFFFTTRQLMILQQIDMKYEDDDWKKEESE